MTYDHVDIVPYNPEWPKMANLEIDKLRAIPSLNKIIDIQHVGSTAVPGLSAKPIIDIQKVSLLIKFYNWRKVKNKASKSYDNFL